MLETGVDADAFSRLAFSSSIELQGNIKTLFVSFPVLFSATLTCSSIDMFEQIEEVLEWATFSPAETTMDNLITSFLLSSPFNTKNKNKNFCSKTRLHERSRFVVFRAINLLHANDCVPSIYLLLPFCLSSKVSDYEEEKKRKRKK